MNPESRIKQILHKHIIAFAVILFFQILSLVIINVFLSAFLPQVDIDSETCQTIKIAVTAFFGAIYIICGLIFIFKKILSVNSLKNTTPIKCKIEDFILIGYTDDGHKKYNAYPIVRATNDSKLYLTYGKYSLANLNTSISYMNNKITGIEIYGKNRQPLTIGDTTYVFIQKKIKKPIKIRDGKLKMKNKFIPFLHFNESFKIDNFKSITVFKGITTV